MPAPACALCSNMKVRIIISQTFHTIIIISIKLFIVT